MENMNHMNNTVYVVILLLIGLFSTTCFSQNSDKKMQQILSEKRIFNKTDKNTNGFRIQLYNGLSETKARNTLGAFSTFFPDIATLLIYEQPEWKAQTITFRTELEAYKIWLKVREEFEGTFIFESKQK